MVRTAKKRQKTKKKVGCLKKILPLQDKKISKPQKYSLQMEEKQYVIQYEDVDLSFDKMILTGINLTIEKGEFVYLIGKTGSGKSSLLRSIYADIPIEAGAARVCGFDLNKMRRSQIPMLRRKLGIVFQDFQLLKDRSVFDNLAFVLRATGMKDKQTMK